MGRYSVDEEKSRLALRDGPSWAGVGAMTGGLGYAAHHGLKGEKLKWDKTDLDLDRSMSRMSGRPVSPTHEADVASIKRRMKGHSTRMKVGAGVAGAGLLGALVRDVQLQGKAEKNVARRVREDQERYTRTLLAAHAQGMRAGQSGSAAAVGKSFDEEVSKSKKLLKNHAKAAAKAGWKVRQTRKGHVQFIPPDESMPIVTTGGTPSDHRSIKNFEAQLRRSGANWFGKSERDPVAGAIEGALIGTALGTGIAGARYARAAQRISSKEKLSRKEAVEALKRRMGHEAGLGRELSNTELVGAAIGSGAKRAGIPGAAVGAWMGRKEQPRYGSG